MLPTPPSRPALGPIGEEIAARALADRGYRILERNLRSRVGEIDLLATEGETLVAVEVKARTVKDASRMPHFGRPAEAVTATRLSRLERAVEDYCHRVHRPPGPCRIDVVEVLLSPKGEVLKLVVLRNVTG
ncbi:MAG: YraN family protein [Planctomycetes bacterium]|nr:YraN family protein [Planctomycetota bacterium]